MKISKATMEVLKNFASINSNILVREGNVKAAAYAAGFSEPTSFFRAFKRWTGKPPSAFR